MKLYVYLLGFIAYALSVYSCKNENDELSETSLANISGIEVYWVRNTHSELQNIYSLAFTGANIGWFNVTTREIKLKNIKLDPNRFPVNSKLEFRIKDCSLFITSSFVTNINSQVFLDLVLFYDIIEDKYYLDDCYPNTKAIKNTAEVQQRIFERTTHWEVFINTLKAEKKLRQ